MKFLNYFKKQPTAKEDFIAYANGGKKAASTTYNDYVSSVEALDKSVRVISNIASMAFFETYKDTAVGLQPFKVKNIDFEYNTTDQDSQHDLISMIFSSIMTQGAAIILTEQNPTTKFINFYAYDISRFRIETTENNFIDHFIYTSEGGSEVTFTPDKLIYIAPRLSSNNLIYAVSRLKSLNDMLTLQSSLMTQTNSYYQAGGKDSAIISPKEPMSSVKAQELKTAFDTFLQTPATKTLFINTEVDVKSVSNAQSPSQIMDALFKINTLIVQQFGIPEYFFGNYTGYVNDAAVTTASRLFFQIHMQPIFKSVSYQFTRYFRNTLKIKDCKVVFNFRDIKILEDNLQTKITDATNLWKVGLISLNEARERCELSKLPDDAADKHFLPAYLTGSVPVTIEGYDPSTLTNTQSDILSSSGTTGGADNANKVNGSTGGKGNTGG